MSPLPTPDETLSLACLLWLPVCIAGFFLPGRLFGDRGSPCPWATGFVASFLLFFHLALACDLVGVPLGRGIVLAFAASGIGWLLFRLYRQRPQIPGLRLPREGRLLLVPPLILVVGIVAGLHAAPLSCWDNFFRWNHLALLVEANGSLAHYPPVGTADYAAYPWIDGIPPGLSLLNASIYLVTGSTHPLLTAARVLAELGLIFALTWRLAHSLWGEKGAGLAVAILATSGLFCGALLLNQEGGLASVFVLLLAYLLTCYATGQSRRIAVWIGLTAGALALVRDYNLLYIAVALLLLASARAGRRDLLLALGAATLAAAPWYIRNAWLTGNPLFPQTLGGVGAGNPMYEAFNGVLRDRFSALLHSAGATPWLHYAATILAGGGLAFLLGAPVLFRAPRALRFLAGLTAATVLLGWLALPLTAGGWNYASRVLVAAVPLCAAAAGFWARHLARPSLRRAAAVLLVLLAIDASWRGRFFFSDPLALPGRRPAGPANGDLLAEELKAQTPLLQTMIFVADGDGILADHPNQGVLGGRLGGHMISPFSPAASPLGPDADGSDTPVSPPALARKLRANGVRFGIFTRSSLDLFKRMSPGLDALLRLPPSMDLGPLIVYDFALLAGENPPRALR